MSKILSGKKVHYTDLNARQKENYNFQKFAGKLADYGYNCIRLNDDWQGADFIACHIDGDEFLKVQLKGRFSIAKKYVGKNIYIAFIDTDESYYIYPHDETVRKIFSLDKVENTDSWKNTGAYDWPHLPNWAITLLRPHKMKTRRRRT